MTSWLAIEYYSPLLVLLMGILTFTGIAGLGLVIQRIMKLSLPAPWGQALGVLIGIQTVSLIVQVFSMAGLAYKPVLIAIWLFIVLAGNLSFAKWALPLVPRQYQKPNGVALFPLLLCLTGLAVNLLVAIAPCVRNDELHYHMLIPSRIVADNALRFYQQPYEGAILPHMIYQIAHTPLHALGFPDAANVVSWCLSLTLVWFGWYLISERAPRSLWPYIWVAPVAIGYWPVVYHVTGGAHVMSDLATPVAMIALFKSESLIRKIGIKKFIFLFSTTLLSIVSSKLTYAPLAFALLLSLIIFLWNQQVNELHLFQTCCYFMAPWIIFYLPIILWTFWQSGSPFGPFLSDFFNDSVYETGKINSTIEISRKSKLTLGAFILQIKKFAIRFPALFWLAIAGIITVRGVAGRIRVAALCLLSFHLLVIYFFAPLEGRYFGAIFQGFLLSFAIFCPLHVQNKMIEYRLKSLLITIFFMPWLFIQIYYAQQFFPISFGYQEKNVFFNKYISFYEDFGKLDMILPKDSAILIEGFSNIFKIPHHTRMSSVYSPRPIYLESNDLPQSKTVFLFQLNKPGDRERLDVPPGYELGKQIYQNDHALYNNLVRIGLSPRELILEVHELHPKAGVRASGQSGSVFE